MATRKGRAPAAVSKTKPSSQASARAVVKSLTSDWYWEQDAELRFTHVDVQTGTPDEQELAHNVLGKRRWETGIEVEGGWDAHRAMLTARAPFREVLMWRDLEDGSRRYVAVSGEPIFDAKGDFTGYRGVGRDVTEQKRGEQLLHLQHTVTRRLAEAASPGEGCEAALRAICESEGWECAEFWRLDEAAGVLRRFVHWGDMQFAPNEGLVGSVWQSAEPLWLPDATFLCPVPSGGHIIGVLGFACRKIRPPDDALLQALLALATQLGLFLRRAEAEARLRESEERFRRTFELADVGVAHIGLDRRFQRVNRRFCEILGYPEAELIGKTGREISHPDDMDAMNTHRPRLYAGDIESVRGEKRYLRKDSSVVWVAYRLALQRDAAGKPQYEIAVYDDISSRKAAEDALRESEARFRQVVDSANEGILVYDRALNIYAANAAATKIVGVPLDELIGKPGFTSLFPCVREDGSPLDPQDRPTRVTTRTGQPVTGMVLGIVRSGGRISWLSVNTAFLRRPEEEAHYGIVSTISDITTQKRGEQLLRLEHQVARAFASAINVSDALKAALRAICESEHWECGRYLRVDTAAGELRFGEAWSVPNADIERYLEQSRSMVYRPGVGLVGRVWQSGEPLWVPDITNDPRVARAALARETGMRGAFAVPVITEGRTIGVCIFHSREIREPDERLLQAIGVIGGQMGQFVQRAQAEQAMRDSEGRFRSLTALSSDWFWEQDADYRFTRLEGHNIAGGDQALRERLVGSRRWENGLEIEGGWEAHRALLDARRPFHDVLMWRTLSDGSLRYVSVSGEPVFAADGGFAGYRGVGRDITEQKRDEQMLRLEHRVANALSEAADATAGLTGVMQLIGEAEGWGCGRYFFVDKAADELVYRQGWSTRDPALQKFLDGSQGLRFKRGQGLAGIAWQTGEPIWSSDTSQDPRVMAKSLASSSGTRGAFIFSIRSEGDTIGVLSFSSQSVRKPDARLIQAMRVIGGEIGQFLRRMQAEESLRESELRFRSLTEMSSDFFWETDVQHRFIDLVQGAGYAGKMDQVRGKTPWELPSSHPDAAGWSAIRATMDAHAPFRDFEFGRPRADGTLRYFSVSGEPHFAADGSFVGYRGVGRDITDIALARERIASLAYHDALTGLDNRISLGPALEKAVERTRRRGSKIAGLFLDLDGFKQINDLHGHDAGDRLLIEAARRLRTSLRASDPVARLGGDEFFVVLEDVHDAAPVERVAQKLLSALEQPYDIGVGKEVRVSASIGVSMFPDDAGDAGTLMKHADMAMYGAKQAGKNAYRFFISGPAANDARPAADKQLS
jgi:diguanylate cyclase (GGDEF)-like protein/PAS domain S-box-containing protein